MSMQSIVLSRPHARRIDEALVRSWPGWVLAAGRSGLAADACRVAAAQPGRRKQARTVGGADLLGRGQALIGVRRRHPDVDDGSVTWTAPRSPLSARSQVCPSLE